ncbi:MAG: SseB family protein [Myxococcales bacterium]|nr:MAG: SseB family protein [Myxococcales bacterium]
MGSSARPPENPARLEAMHRLLKEAQRGGQAKVDALVALIAREVYAVRSQQSPSGLMHYQDSVGHLALPIFTDGTTLAEAAERHQWQVNGSPDSLGIKLEVLEAFRYALGQNFAGILVDMEAPHSVSISRQEMLPFLDEGARREIKSPYAVRGRLSSTLIQAVQATPSQAPDSIVPPPPPPQALAKRSKKKSEVDLQTALNLTDLSDLDHELMEAIAAGLRDFPEVEWAASAAGCFNSSCCTVCLRVDPGYRTRLEELYARIHSISAEQSKTVDLRLLDDPELTRLTREKGHIFYPWARDIQKTPTNA